MNTQDEKRGSDSATAMTAPSMAAIPRIDARQLLAGGREVVIVHAGRDYRLRVTSNGKLILTA